VALNRNLCKIFQALRAYVHFPQAGDGLFGCQGVKVGVGVKTGCWYIS
jgi:hypothetical protein